MEHALGLAPRLDEVPPALVVDRHDLTRPECLRVLDPLVRLHRKGNIPELGHPDPAQVKDRHIDRRVARCDLLRSCERNGVARDVDRLPITRSDDESSDGAGRLLRAVRPVLGGSIGSSGEHADAVSRGHGPLGKDAAGGPGAAGDQEVHGGSSRVFGLGQGRGGRRRR